MIPQKLFHRVNPVEYFQHSIFIPFYFAIPRSNSAYIEKKTFGLFHGGNPVDFEIIGILIYL
jgi:hypothetical protein